MAGGIQWGGFCFLWLQSLFPKMASTNPGQKIYRTQNKVTDAHSEEKNWLQHRFLHNTCDNECISMPEEYYTGMNLNCNVWNSYYFLSNFFYCKASNIQQKMVQKNTKLNGIKVTIDQGVAILTVAMVTKHVSCRMQWPEIH